MCFLLKVAKIEWKCNGLVFYNECNFKRCVSHNYSVFKSAI